MRQRAMIAVALSTNPSLLIADELQLRGVELKPNDSLTDTLSI